MFNATHLLKISFSDRGTIEPAPHKGVVGKDVVYHDRLVTALGAGADAASHFMIEVLPNFLYVLEVLGKEKVSQTDILYHASGSSKDMMRHLAQIGMIDMARVFAIDSRFHFGKEVFFAADFPGSCLTDSHNQAGPEKIGRVRRILAHPPAVDAARNYIILIHRSGVRARALGNEAALEAGVRRVIDGTR